jgi:glutamate N-acetyltransferase/amino-acid N-acetyltransferase
MKIPWPAKQPTAKDVPHGFRFSAAACGLRRTGGLDLALMTSDTPATAAAIFTQNLVQAAPVILSRANVRAHESHMRAIICNAGNANCCTGAAGMRASQDTAAQLARLLGCAPGEIVACSTGVIGVPLRVAAILNALPELVGGQSARAEAFSRVTHAIMTTDTRPKWAATRVRIAGKEARLLGCAKGAGMIHPNMATMLAFVLTDAAVPAPLLRRALRAAASRTFNCVTVDGDTSTNDTLAVLANGASGVRIAPHPSRQRRSRRVGHPKSPLELFTQALEKVCRSLAMQIASDGEGAKRLVEIHVRGARREQDAKRVAESIATSPLVKTALAGADPNWGRILAAAGRSGVQFDPARASIWLAGVKVFARGRPLPMKEASVSRAMDKPFVPIVVDLGLPRPSPLAPRPSSHVWTCDFTHDYVTINASYRT